MALAALVDGERTDATRFNADEWNALKVSKPLIELYCCKTKGFMRVSKRGTRHFVHARKPDTCTSGPESELHLHLKTVIAESVRAAEWNAEVEKNGPDAVWRADVMAIRRNLRIAFEVQLSPIMLSEMETRQAIYAAHDVRGCWFYGSRALDKSPPANEPMFPILNGEDDTVYIGSRPTKIRDAVISLLKGRFRHCTKQRRTAFQNITIYRFSRCWACGKDFDIFSIIEQGTTCWDKPSTDNEDQGYPLPLFKAGAPWIVERVHQFTRANPQLNLKLTPPGFSYAESSRRRHYTFRCYHCGQFTPEEIFEQLLLEGECMQDPTYGIHPIASIKLQPRITMEEEPHWCFSPSRQFCC